MKQIAISHVVPIVIVSEQFPVSKYICERPYQLQIKDSIMNFQDSW